MTSCGSRSNSRVQKNTIRQQLPTAYYSIIYMLLSHIDGGGLGGGQRLTDYLLQLVSIYPNLEKALQQQRLVLPFLSTCLLRRNRQII